MLTIPFVQNDNCKFRFCNRDNIGSTTILESTIDKRIEGINSCWRILCINMISSWTVIVVKYEQGSHLSDPYTYNPTTLSLSTSNNIILIINISTIKLLIKCRRTKNAWEGCGLAEFWSYWSAATCWRLAINAKKKLVKRDTRTKAE